MEKFMPQAISIKNKAQLQPYADAASHHIKLLMTDKRFRYEDLVDKLKERGIVYSSSNLRNKVSSNALSSALFFILVDIMTGETKADIAVTK
tara:strand:+ start:806 stop:1081 length:276 start_codon:yes stop_codon:yes gene_type:complete